jgi:hypothetical protein
MRHYDPLGLVSTGDINDPFEETATGSRLEGGRAAALCVYASLGSL